MSNIAIQVDRLSKRYKIGAVAQRNKTLREALTEAFVRPFRLVKRSFNQASGGERTDAHIWALRDVSFNIYRGEVVGIIGRNGAGKSTLLKILSRITEPTEGVIKLRGRIGSLLEVGTGFHSELTGEENIYLSGSILGMTSREITRKFDDIVKFSEIEKFVNTPVKHYSSGMYMRLAFAVAAYLEPEILLVDEVLAVGDAQFQKKCLGKMGDVAKAGRTVLFVSHNMPAVQSLCERAIWINNGSIVEDGPAADVTASYLGTSLVITKDQVWHDKAAAPGNDAVRLHRVSLKCLDENQAGEITLSTPFVMTFEYWNMVSDAHLNLSLVVNTQQGFMAFNTAPVKEPRWNGKPFPVGLFRSSCYIPAGLLNDDLYSVTLLVVKDAAHILFSLENALVFQVVDDSQRIWHGKWQGVVRPDLKWETEFIAADQSGTPSI